MFMVMMALAVASIMALTFLGGQTTSTALARNAAAQAQARMIAEDVAALARGYVTDTPDWREQVSHGNWTAEASWGGGTYRVRFEDPEDADLSDDASQPVRAVIEARYGGASHRLETRLTPGTPVDPVRVMLVVGDAPPSVEDQQKHELFLRWGFTVQTVLDDAGQSVYDEAAAVSDVIYVSENVLSSSVGTKLDGYDIGIVNEEQALLDELQFSSGASTTSGSTIRITDADHPMTRDFEAGELTISDSVAELKGLSGPAAGVGSAATLADGSTRALAYFEVGDPMLDGNPSPNRRVSSPFGYSDFSVDQLNAAGQLLLRRIIEWAADGEPTGGLVHHWPLDEGSGAAADDVAGGLDASYTQGPSLGGAGAVGQAIELDNGSDRLTLPTATLQGRSSLTFSVWVRTTHRGGQCVLSSNRADMDDVIKLYLASPTALQLYRENNYATWSVPDLADGRWHLVTATIDAQTNRYRIYTDGQLRGTVSAGTLPIDVQHVVLGEEQDAVDGAYDTSQAWIGGLDDVRIYDRALNAPEIQQLYEQVVDTSEAPALVVRYDFDEPPAETPTLVGHWPLDEASAYPAHYEAGGTAASEAINVSGFAYGSGAAASSYWDYFSDSSASSGGALITRPNDGVNTGLSTIGPRLDYHFIFTNPGTYRLWARLKGGGSDDSIHVGFDGTPLTTAGGTGMSNNASTSWSWTDDVAGGAQNISVNIPSAGRHTINVWMREDGTALDKLMLTKTGAVPSGSGPAQGAFYAHCEDEADVRHGTYQNFPLAGRSGFGDGGTSVQFDGSNDRVEVPHVSSYLLDEASVSFWFRADDLDGLQGLVAKDSSGYDNGGHFRVVLDGGVVKCRLQSVSASYEVQGGTAVAGQWHHVVAGMGPGGLRLYFDGALVDRDAYAGGLGASSGGSGNAEPWTFGVDQVDSNDQSSAGWSNPFGGRLDDVRLYDQNLGAQQVANLYARQPPGPSDTDRVLDTAGAGLPLDLTIDDADRVTWVDSGLRIDAVTRISSGAAATKLHDALADAPGMTLEVEFTPENVTQTGPARIFSYASGTASRNLHLAQSDAGYEVKLRTTYNTSGEPAAQTSSGLTAQNRQHLIVTYDGQQLQVFRNGRLELSEIAPGGMANWSRGHLLTLANEVSGDRGWLGTLHRVAVWDAAVDKVQARNLFAGRDPGPPANLAEYLTYEQQWLESP